MTLTLNQVQGVVDKFNNFFQKQHKKARVATLAVYPKVDGDYQRKAYILIGYTARVNKLNMTPEYFKDIFAGVDGAEQEYDDYSFYSVNVDNKYDEKLLLYHYKQGYNKKLSE